MSRLDYGKKYCHNSPTLDEGPLQKAIFAAINRVMSQKNELAQTITAAMEQELAPNPGRSMRLADIARRLEQIDQETREILIRATQENSYEAYTEQLQDLMIEAAALKENRKEIKRCRQENGELTQRIETAASAMQRINAELTEWDKTMIRQLVETVRVISAEKIEVTLRGGNQIVQGICW